MCFENRTEEAALLSSTGYGAAKEETQTFSLALEEQRSWDVLSAAEGFGVCSIFASENLTRS